MTSTHAQAVPRVPPDFADRFLTAWKRIERHLSDERALTGGRGDMSDTLHWAERTRTISPQIEDFLQACRQVRNAHAHVAFEGYEGPVSVPPREIVERLERIAVGLLSPGRAITAARRATVCSPDTPLLDALAVMGAADFSQLPYRDETLGWVLFTRSQLSCLVQGTIGPHAIQPLDGSITVGTLAALPNVGPTIPRILERSVSATIALDELESALRTPDHLPGGYPALLIVDEATESLPAILTADDLPRLYDLLGR